MTLRRRSTAARRAAPGLLALAMLGALGACGDGAPPPALPRPVASAPATVPTPTPSASAAPDPLGGKPALPAPPPYTPPVPVAYERANGMTVWLVERHALPIVSMQIVVPAGASRDPAGKGGLAAVTANMLDEGAGARGALEIARDVDRLGATLHTGAYADYAYAQLTTLKKNLAPAAAILGDVVGKPTFSAVEYKRVKDLWLNELVARQSEPQAVADVVSLRQVFGEQPYGHPTTGTTKSAAKVTLDDVKAFYAAAWRPERATCVVVGDVTRAELDPLLDGVLSAWKPERRPAEIAVSAAPARPASRRVVVVDRPGAPQSVIAVVRTGVAASDADAPALVRVNGALGGSFTSRLNQDLREEHGWSYGARSRFTFTGMPGMFSAYAAVHTEHTGDALKAMLADVKDLADKGLTDEEVHKTALLARAELVESFEGVEAATRRLSRNAGVGLPPDHEARASASLYAATKADLGRLAAKYLDATNAVVVIVGPRAEVARQLEAIGMKALEASGPEGE